MDSLFSDWVPAFAGTTRCNSMLAGFRRSRTPGVFIRRVGVNGKSVHAPGEFRREQRVDHAVAVDPALPFESLRHDINPEVSFVAGLVAGMTFVQMRLVEDVKAFGMKSRVQFLRDDVSGCHDIRNIAG